MEVDNYWDRGLLGLALDPNFPTDPYVYVLYTFDAPIGGTAPTWSDACPTPPGPTTDGCMVSGRLSRLTADPTSTTVLTETVLINNWCQQFPSHSMGTLFFGPDGALYVSAGEGASFTKLDHGQYGNTYAGDQVNPCGDPPTAAGTPPPNDGTAEGGALRSQSLNRRPGEPVVLNGTILRVDPATGEALPTNPLYGSSDANARRIIGYGLRNPFRFTFRPGTHEIWVGDVGASAWEEIDRIITTTAATVNNFGWPCYEGDNSGSAIMPGFQSANLNICNTLYANPGSVTAPYYAYQHGVQVVPGESCLTANGASITGLAFYSGGSYPAAYNGALFFADNTQHCIWVMSAGANGLPDKTKIANFVTSAAYPVDLEIGPGGDLFYVDYNGGTIRRIQYVGPGNQPPVAVITAQPTNGVAPLAVSFDGTGSYDLDPGDHIASFAWDLNGDGVFDDATTSTTTYTYTASGVYTASLKVTDQRGATGTSSIVISADNTAPTAVIDSPAQAACAFANPCWAVGDTINFSGHATDPQQGTLPASDLTWDVILHHCPTDINSCHTHHIQTFSGVSSGSFSAPDHDYPSYLEIQLTATDGGGLQNTTSVLLYPKTVNLNLLSSPSGLELNLNGNNVATPFVHAVIVNSSNSISAPSPQDLSGLSYAFESWSDNGDRTHDVVAGTSDMTDTANYGPISADVQIVKTGALSAGKMTYTLQVKNNGPAPAQGVVTTDTLPGDQQYVSASTTQGSCTGGSTVTCPIGTLANAQVVTVTIGVNLPSASGSISNTATVSASVSSPDPDTTNNASTLSADLLSVGLAGNGSGTVSSGPPGIDCGGTCDQIFAEGTVVTLSATPAVSSTFAGWSGGCGGLDLCVISMTQATAVTATFVVNTYTLAVGRTGNGAGSVTSLPVGIDCGSTCSSSFNYGTAVSLTAWPGTSASFAGWKGACAGQEACAVTMTQASAVTATFSLKSYTVTVVITGTGHGIVTSAPAGMTCSLVCAESFTYGTPLTLTAVPATRSTFGGWGGGCEGTSACQLVVTQGVTLTATFNGPVPQFNAYLPMVTQGSAPAGFPPARTADDLARSAGTDSLFRFSRRPWAGPRVSIVAGVALLHEVDIDVQLRG